MMRKIHTIDRRDRVRRLRAPDVQYNSPLVAHIGGSRRSATILLRWNLSQRRVLLTLVSGYASQCSPIRPTGGKPRA